MRFRASKSEDLPKTTNSIIESLRGEAAQVAMNLGEDDLIKPDGIEQLVKAMRAHVFPQARAEAKELYKMGHKAHGTRRMAYLLGSTTRACPTTSYVDADGGRA
jgi:hypothetical protein